MTDDSLPPSARYVLDVLEDESSISRQALLERTGLPPSTLDGAIERLERRGYLVSAREPEDLRAVRYEYRERADP
ncbi:MAG: MarR family transcriptional regulator [Armatimonadota bacterium]